MSFLPKFHRKAAFQSMLVIALALTMKSMMHPIIGAHVRTRVSLDLFLVADALGWVGGGGAAATAEYGSVHEWLKWALMYTNVYISSLLKKIANIANVYICIH